MGENEEVVLFRLSEVEKRMDKLEEKEEKRTEEQSIIQKAIIEIQLSSKLTAETLAKLENRFEKLASGSTDKWFKLFEKMIVILAAIIGALLGTKLM
jgi:uncharacterized coiled-coil protein SlyX